MKPSLLPCQSTALRAACPRMSEHSPEGCVPQDGCRLCSRGCSRVPRAVVQSRVPAVPQGLCAGAGTLPPARLSTQPARGAAQGAAGRRGPCCAPGAVCRGRDSAACQAQHSACPGSCPGRCGETCGGKEPPGRAGAFCCHSCCLGQGDHSYAAPPSVECFQEHFARGETRQGFLFPVLREGKRMGS